MRQYSDTKNPAAKFATGVSYSRKSRKPAPHSSSELLPKIALTFIREAVSDLRPLPAGAKFRTATAGLLTRSVCDAFPTRKSVARESRTRSPRNGGAGTYSSGNCSGFAPDSHLIPSIGTLRRTSGNRCRAKIAIFSKRPLPSAVFFETTTKKEAPANGQPPISGTHPAPPVVTRYFTNSSGMETGLPVRRTVGIGAFHPRSLLPSSAASSFTFAGCSAARLCCSPMSSARL